MYQWLGDQTIEIQKASEPSDIIWENRHFTPAQRFQKTIITWLVIGFSLALSFIVVFISRQYSNEMSMKYPATDCTPYYENYPGSLLEPFAM